MVAIKVMEVPVLFVEVQSSAHLNGLFFIRFGKPLESIEVKFMMSELIIGSPASKDTVERQLMGKDMVERQLMEDKDMLGRGCDLKEDIDGIRCFIAIIDLNI